MFTRLRLKNFKSFKELDVRFGPLNVLIGTNASGKSNLREAFRFLHGIGRGYSLIEILGEKWGQGGDLLWTGLRGGPTEVTTWGEEFFEIEVEIWKDDQKATYLISVEKNSVPTDRVAEPGGGELIRPRVVRERLTVDSEVLFEVAEGTDLWSLDVAVVAEESAERARHSLLPIQPAITQLYALGQRPKVQAQIKWVLDELTQFRFLEPQPTAIRRPSYPGAQLGDHGENLAATLFAFQDPSKLGVFLEFLQALTPMDVQGLRFSPDHTGRIHLWLREQGGKEVSLASASDGTLRFMALLTLMLAEDSKIFLEEIETGLHPSRLALLLEILQQSAESHHNQIFATSHSPQLLTLLGEKAAECGYLALRNEETGYSTLVRLGDLPTDAVKVLKNGDLGDLLSSGWFEDIGYFEGVGS